MSFEVFEDYSWPDMTMGISLADLLQKYPPDYSVDRSIFPFVDPAANEKTIELSTDSESEKKLIQEVLLIQDDQYQSEDIEDPDVEVEDLTAETAIPEPTEPVQAYANSVLHRVLPETIHYVTIDKQRVDHDSFNIVGFLDGCNLIGRCQKVVLSWRYESSVNLFVVIRSDGLQYFPFSFKALSSLPYYNLFSLARKELLFTRKFDEKAALLKKILSREVKNNSFSLFTPTWGKKFKYKKKIDPRTGECLVERVFPFTKCLQSIPLAYLPQDCLSNFGSWQYDCRAYDAVIYDAKYKEILRVYDPLHLVTLSSSDLKTLSRYRMTTYAGETALARMYEHVVHVCVTKGYHSGNLPLKI